MILLNQNYEYGWKIKGNLLKDLKRYDEAL